MKKKKKKIMMKIIILKFKMKTMKAMKKLKIIQ